MNAALWLLWVAPLTAAAQAAVGDGAAWARDAAVQALSASAGIQDPFRRAQSLAEIAEIETSLDGAAVAVSILQRAAESAGKIDNASLAGWARHDIALAYVKAGELDLAQNISSALAKLAEVHESRGSIRASRERFARSVALARGTRASAERRGAAFVRIADALAEGAR